MAKNRNGGQSLRSKHVLIIESNPRTAVVVLSMREDESSVLHSLKAGAKAYVLKSSSLSIVRRAVKGRRAMRLSQHGLKRLQNDPL